MPFPPRYDLLWAFFKRVLRWLQLAAWQGGASVMPTRAARAAPHTAIFTLCTFVFVQRSPDL